MCTECGSVLHEQTNFCQYCGKEDNVRKTTKKDYKLKFKKMKEL
nr:MAG: Zn finger protein [uncultured archaeon]